MLPATTIFRILSWHIHRRGCGQQSRDVPTNPVPAACYGVNLDAERLREAKWRSEEMQIGAISTPPTVGMSVYGI